MRLGRILLSFGVLAACLSAAGPDPVLGKWKMNAEKSHAGGPPLRSAIRTYAARSTRTSWSTTESNSYSPAGSNFP